MIGRLASLGVLLALSACSRGSGVVYKVTGNGPDVDVSYTSQGAISMSNEKLSALPWEHKIPERPRGPMMLTARTKAKDIDLSCEIWVDGKMVAQAKTTGGFASPATCMALSNTK